MPHGDDEAVLGELASEYGTGEEPGAAPMPASAPGTVSLNTADFPQLAGLKPGETFALTGSVQASDGGIATVKIEQFTAAPPAAGGASRADMKAEFMRAKEEVR